MSRIASASLGWLVAATLAIAVAWQGVAVVGQQVTSNRTPVIDHTEIVALVARPQGPEVGASSAGSTSSSTSVGVAAVPGSTSAPPPTTSGADLVESSAGPTSSDVTQVVPGPTSSDVTQVVPGPTSSDVTQVVPGPTSSDVTQVVPGPTTTLPRPPPQTSAPTTTEVAPSGQLQVFSTTGGIVYVLFTPDSGEDGAAELSNAVPNSGFSVDDDSGGGKVQIEFRSPSHRSRLDAWWADGPQHRIREDDGEDRDDDRDDRDDDDRDDRDDDDRDDRDDDDRDDRD